MKKIIGNLLLICGLVFFFIGMLNLAVGDGEWFRVCIILYAVGIIGGGILRIGDFLKWCAKKFQQGVNEANQTMGQSGSKLCLKCGKSMTEDSAFCPGCGKKVN